MSRVPQLPVQAFLVCVLGIALFSGMDAVMKGLVLAIGTFTTMFWRNLIGIAISGIAYLPRSSGWPSRATMGIHLARGVLSTAMGFLFFWGIGRVPLAQAIALTFIAPLIALLLSAVSSARRSAGGPLAGSLIAFAGVIVIFLGQALADLGPEALIGSIAIIGSACCYAVNIILMRRQALAAKPLEINFFQSVTVAILWLRRCRCVGAAALAFDQWPWLVARRRPSSIGAV